MISSTAGPPSSGRSPSSAHWSGCRRNVCSASPSWLRVVSMPAKARNTRPDDELTLAQRLVLLVGGDQGADEVVARTGYDGRRPRPRRSSVSPSSAASIRGRSWRTLMPKDLPRSSAQCATCGPLLLGQPEQLAQHPGGVRLGELAHELHPPPRRERVDELAGQLLELRPHRLDRPAAERRAEQPPQPQVVLALQAEQRLAPPLHERPVVDAVLGRPPGVALLEPAVLEHRRALLVAQDRPAVRRPGVPVAARAPRGRPPT